ncbi:MAG: chorismate synthase [Piptocephalis tieghemiana]|nr:MAG: chorismate synthase [Piptocephalis tieghemiana]
MSTFGSHFRVTTYGESHCKSVGCIIDGCPPGMVLTESDIQKQLTRRRPGQSALTTPRDEKDRVEIQSGLEYGITLGTPIGLRVENQDQRPYDYSETDQYPRPSHADWTYLQKYGVKASSGGGRASARETIGRVAAGAIAEKYLEEAYGVEIVAFVSGVGPVQLPFLDTVPSSSSSSSSSKEEEANFTKLISTITRETVDRNTIRCPDPKYADLMTDEIMRAKEASDSIGGLVTCVIRNAPVGLGEPCFDKLEAKLAHAMLSIPATKGFEIGSGFQGTCIPGHLHNDPWVRKDMPGGGTLGTRSNHSGGIQGGISNGEAIYFRTAFKPPATISQAQSTASYQGVDGVLAARGRHDPCVVPRAVPIVEAMAALVLMDMVMIQNARQAAMAHLPKNIRIHPSLLGKIPSKEDEPIQEDE